MIKVVYSVDKFNEEMKEYAKHRRSRFTQKSDNSDYPITGISFKVTTPEKFKDPKVRELLGRNDIIFDECLPLLGRYCKLTSTNEEGTFIGIEITEEDAYYMLKTSKGVIYDSCVGGIEDKFPGIEY